MTNFSVVEFNIEKIVSNKVLSKNDILNQIVKDIQERDFFILDPNDNSNISILVIKKDSILIKLDYLRCILLYNKIIIFSNNNLKTNLFLKVLDQNFKLHNKSSTIFEFIVLEAILIHICQILEQNLSQISNQVNNFLKKISESCHNYKFSVNIQIELLKKEFQFKEIKDLITELLQSDEDMTQMYLTRNLNNHNIHNCPQINDINQNNDHSELEVLLENYEKLVDELNDRLKRMIREIDISQKIANLGLATQRNDIALLNTKVSMMSSSLSIGSLIASLFGMNLKNNYEDNNLAFIIVCSIISVVCLSSIIFSISFFIHKY